MKCSFHANTPFLILCRPYRLIFLYESGPGACLTAAAARLCSGEVLRIATASYATAVANDPFLLLCIQRSARTSGLPAPNHRLARFFVGSLAALGLALVPGLLALGQSHLHLHSAVPEVQLRGNQSQSLLLRLGEQLAQLILLHQELPRAQRFVVEDITRFVTPNV